MSDNEKVVEYHIRNERFLTEFCSIIFILSTKYSIIGDVLRTTLETNDFDKSSVQRFSSIRRNVLEL
jgi:hypothetical protein